MKLFKKLYRFLVDNYFLSIFFASIAFVILVSVYKLFFVKPTYIFVKVKMGQGLWWASTQKPSMWFIKSLKNQMEEKDLTDKPLTKILSLRYYPWYPNTNQYDVYLIMRLKVSKTASGNYNFKRSAIGVGSPVDFEFPQNQFSGTIIELSEKPIKDQLTEKTIILTKRNADPWEYDSIKLGDFYFDGKEKVFEILEKKATDTQTLTADIFGNYPDINPEMKKYVFLKAKIKVKQADNTLLFGEEQVIAPGKTINIATNNLHFSNYVVAKIEN